MSKVNSQSSKPLTYSSRTIERAQRSLVCSPLHLKLLEQMQQASVPLQAIAGTTGVQHGYTKRPLSELTAENNLLWLIQVGVLRREVDGQGITDSFRLTPLGRQLLEQYQGKTWRQPAWSDRAYNALDRWFRLPL